MKIKIKDNKDKINGFKPITFELEVTVETTEELINIIRANDEGDWDLADEFIDNILDESSKRLLN